MGMIDGEIIGMIQGSTLNFYLNQFITFARWDSGMTWLLRKSFRSNSFQKIMYKRSPQVRDCGEVHADGNLEEEEGEEGYDGVDVRGAWSSCHTADRHRRCYHQQAVLQIITIEIKRRR